MPHWVKMGFQLHSRCVNGRSPNRFYVSQIGSLIQIVPPTRLGLASRLAVARLGLATVSRCDLLAAHRSDLQILDTLRAGAGFGVTASLSPH